MVIKAAKRIFNSDKICRSYSDLNFGVTFFGTQCSITLYLSSRNSWWDEYNSGMLVCRSISRFLHRASTPRQRVRCSTGNIRPTHRQLVMLEVLKYSDSSISRWQLVMFELHKCTTTDITTYTQTLTNRFNNHIFRTMFSSWSVIQSTSHLIKNCQISDSGGSH